MNVSRKRTLTRGLALKQTLPPIQNLAAKNGQGGCYDMEVHLSLTLQARCILLSHKADKSLSLLVCQTLLLISFPRNIRRSNQQFVMEFSQIVGSPTPSPATRIKNRPSRMQAEQMPGLHQSVCASLLWLLVFPQTEVHFRFFT